MKMGEEGSVSGFEHEAASTEGRRFSKEKLTSAVENAKRQVSDVADRYELRDRIEAHPLRAVGLALGAGYVLGGGLFTALTARLLFGGVRVGMRLAALPFLRDELMGLIGERGRFTGGTERREQ